MLFRSFLATANACINCRTGVIDVSFGNKKLRLNVFGASQRPSMDSCFEVDTLEDIIEDAIHTILAPDPLDTCLAHFGVYDFEGYMKEVNILLDTPYDKTTPPWTIKYEPLPTFCWFYCI